MAFTEVARLATTTVRTTAQTATNSYTLPSAPASGQWIVVALYTNQGIIPTGAVTGANNLVTSVTCGSVSLSVLEASTNTSVHTPTIYAAPYTAGMTTTLSVTWQNGVATTTLGVAVLIFSGATNSVSVGSVMNFRQDGGAFDGAGGTTFGSTAAESSSSIITWTNSNGAIPTNYDSQQEPFICALTATSSFNATTGRQVNGFPASVDGSGNVTSLGQTAGTLVLQTSPSGAATSGKGVIYSPSGNFVFTYTGVTTTPSFTLTGCTTTAPTTASIPAYCQIMLPINATNTLTEVLPTTSLTSGTLGGFQTGNTSAYSGTSTANGSVQVAITGGTTAVRLVLMGGASSNSALKQSAYANLKLSGSNLPVGGGILYTFVPTVRTETRTSSALRVVASLAAKSKTFPRLARAAQVRATKALKTYTNNRTAKATHVRAAQVSKIANFVRVAKATHVRAAKALKIANFVRLARATHVRSARAVKVLTFNRTSQATQAVSATVTKRVSLTRRASATMNYAISSSKTRTLVRRAIATAIALGSAAKSIVIRTHPGTVEGSFKTATVQSKAEYGIVTGSFATASVGTKSKVGAVEGSFKTASVSTQSKFLVKD